MRLALLLWLLICTVGVAQTRPATRGGRGEQLRQWLGQLGDADEARRNEARRGLLGMNRAELEQFARVVRESRPLAPAQAAGLREIVTHAFLAGEEYAGDPNLPFLGVLPMTLTPSGGGEEEGAGQAGVVIAGRVPGFVGYQAFEDGDVLLGLRAESDGQALPLRSREELFERMARLRPGQRTTFQVLRRGQVMAVPVRLDARPAETMELEGLQFRRQEKADAYWDENFALLLGEKTS